jgi:hypothetical protein
MRHYQRTLGGRRSPIEKKDAHVQLTSFRKGFSRTYLRESTMHRHALCEIENIAKQNNHPDGSNIPAL